MPTEPKKLHLGFALNLGLEDRSPEATARLYQDVADTILYAEGLGIDGVWVGQHHFDNTPGPVPSPLVLLAAVAGRTRHIQLGTGIVTLPLEEPLRLAEDAAVLDILSGGRVHLGLGTGGANLGAFDAFGLEATDRHDLYDSRLARLHDVLDGKPVSEADGAPRIQPHVPGLRGRIWQGVTSHQRAADAAAAKDGIQLGAFFDPVGTGQYPKARTYVEQWKAWGNSGEPRVGLFRFLYLGESKDQVAAELDPVLGKRLPFLGVRARISGNDSLAGLTTREYLDQVALFGSPEDVAAEILQDPLIRDFGTDLVANFSYHDTFDPAHARRQLELLATRVGPAIGWSRSRP
ncbi:putative FMN-dependent luciferase-like monooxygenase [Arthrobacter ginkgonis]|uniref:FMN-dependent luciferase-like monooxygenase n=1 Tax=Arthrobacter ginkgonis TaxID=1630594 RepID=A0ABP7C960_9MICC